MDFISLNSLEIITGALAPDTGILPTKQERWFF